MKNLLLLIVPLAVASAGCTATSLGRNTVNQIQTAADYRSQATLHALAMVAADPGTLPSFSLLSNGVTSVSDTGVANSVTTWTGSPVRFASEALAFTGSHSPQIQWTVDPVADDTQLEAMRCACRWVLEGPFSLDEDCLHILDDPEADPTPGAHFGVAQRLVRLPEHWLGIGRACDVPHGACYQDHCGDKYVWVTPDGTEGLANFTLVLQDIATLNVAPSDNSLPANRTPPLLVTLWVVQNAVEPAPADARIIITKDPTTRHLVFRSQGDSAPNPGPIIVIVGQYVTWHNTTSDQVTLKSPVFDHDVVIDKGKRTTRIMFDQSTYTKAGGPPNGRVAISVSSTNPAGDDNAQLTLTTDPSRTSYSPTLVFREDRVIKPDCKQEIERRISAGILHKPPLAPVDISWSDWMMMTTPYQGQRTSAKPGAGTTTPVTQATRLIPPTESGIRSFYRNSTPPKDPLGDE